MHLCTAWQYQNRPALTDHRTELRLAKLGQSEKRTETFYKRQARKVAYDGA